MMLVRMDFHRPLLLLACSLFAVISVTYAGGPVFVNPDVPTIVPTSTNEGNLVTQTVYGFLDFTTTIGNTVMVFSPQSSDAIPVVPPKKEEKKIDSNTIIETKPIEQSVQEHSVIKPSKTQSPVTKKASEPSKKVASLVQVQTINSASSKVSFVTPSKVNVVQGASSVVNVAGGSTPTPPQPSHPLSSKVNVVEAKPSIISQVQIVSNEPVKSPSPTKTEIITKPTLQVVSSITEVKVDDEPAVILGNNIAEPEYDFLSRQPSEVVEETYKVINLKPSQKFHLKHRPSVNKAATKRGDQAHPTGLVTKLGGTVIKDGTTTVHETSVIGTYISGKYAQVLQSTSHVYSNHGKGNIKPSPTLRILKTAAPQLGKGKANKHHRHLEPTPTGSISEETALPVEALFNSQNSIKSSRKPTGPGGSFKPRFKSRQKEPDVDTEDNDTNSSPQPSYKKSHRNRPQSQSNRNSKHHNTTHRPHKPGRNRKSRTRTTPASVRREEETTPFSNNGRRFNRRNKQQRASTQPATTESSSYTRRTYKPKLQSSSVEPQHATTSSLYKFKLNRSPGRWQYKTTPKPRVTIRKQNDEENIITNATITTPSSLQDVAIVQNDVVTPQARSDDVDGLEESESIASIIDDERSTENKLDTPFPLETIKVEVSTPPDFKDIYYEIATIKSPYTFQVGSLKNTRYITVTSTFEKSLVNTPEATISPSASEPLTENILATSSNYAKDNNFLDSSIATLPPIYLASDMETPPLETLTETFSTTQTILKTHLLPVVHSGNETMSSTLIQTYLVTRIVTATKTLPPMEAYHFIPSKTLNEFNSHLDEAGSELHLELEFGDNNEQDGETLIKKAFPSDLDLANIGSDFDLADMDKSKFEGHLRPKKAHAPTPSKNAVIETQPVQPALSPEQLQQLAILRLLNPQAGPQALAQGIPQGQFITTSKPVIKIETVYESHVIPIVNGHNTFLTTLSKPVGTVTKTDYEFVTSTLAAPLPQIQQIPQIPQIPQIQQLNPFAQPQFAVTSSPIVQTIQVTQTQSKVLKLTFGAKTAHTTIFSTTVVPSVVTAYMTASIPVQATAAYPGYFPAPYPQFPFVG